MEVQGDLVATAGFSKRMGQVMADNMVKVFDCRCVAVSPFVESFIIECMQQLSACALPHFFKASWLQQAYGPGHG
jgi:hypothetical protein